MQDKEVDLDEKLLNRITAENARQDAETRKKLVAVNQNLPLNQSNILNESDYQEEHTRRDSYLKTKPSYSEGLSSKKGAPVPKLDLKADIFAKEITKDDLLNSLQESTRQYLQGQAQMDEEEEEEEPEYQRNVKSLLQMQHMSPSSNCFKNEFRVGSPKMFEPRS